MIDVFLRVAVLEEQPRALRGRAARAVSRVSQLAPDVRPRVVELGGDPRFERGLRVIVVIVVEAERIAGREELGESAFAAPLQVALVVSLNVELTTKIGKRAHIPILSTLS